MITQERLKSLVRYFSHSGAMSWRGGRPRVRDGMAVGSINRKGYIVAEVDGKPYQVSRLAWLYHYGEFPSGQIDHINGDKRDNRICNLRDVDTSTNCKNKSLQSNCSSGLMGVAYRADRNKWRVRINDQGVRYAIGHYDTLLDAAAARKSAEIRYGFHPNHGRPQ